MPYIGYGTAMRDEDRYLRNRKGRWLYMRRVPEHAQPFAGRARIEVSLKTTSLETARIRRDAMEEADERYWASLMAQAPQEAAEARYKADKARCLALGFAWKSFDSLVHAAPLPEVTGRVLALGASAESAVALDADALLGGTPRPSLPVSKVLALYFKDIAPDRLRTKSPQQQRVYKKVKQRAVNNFIAVAGDKPVDDITREDAQNFYSWWGRRIAGEKPEAEASGDAPGDASGLSRGGAAKMSPNSGNRDVGNMRKLLDDYYKHIGEEDRQNPFRNLRFRERKTDQKKRPPFPALWIRDKILRHGSFDGLNLQAAAITLTMVETGCRPSELCNLPEDRIHVEAPVPFIEIEFQEERELKTESSIRRIPLVGVSLHAMKACPGGFPRYRDREENFSQIVRKHFLKRGLFPSDRHVIYSLRHSFEDRMKEGGLDSELRRLLMGHAIQREEYGEGGSLEFRQRELTKIVLPYPQSILDGTRR